ncbi:class I SAM-dependent methyltransferase [Chitinophaga caseinilytica]|uniref:Class I SAM-dependent methyltransferase n=1 Tax=Chitinophaga caseinilytica TaxID=2267521 RepID=A0ABZ2Z943_9BACT
MTFKDLFSVQSASYAKFRPDYPPALYAWLASQTPGHAQAWDCGTGNGQCAVHLAGFYENVYATDPSAQQIAHAAPHDRVRYAVEPAENCGLPDASADLVTVGQALHWFRFEDYFREVARVLRPGGSSPHGRTACRRFHRRSTRWYFSCTKARSAVTGCRKTA